MIPAKQSPTSNILPPKFSLTSEYPGYTSFPPVDDRHHAPFYFWRTSHAWQLLLGDPEWQNMPACPPFTCYLALVGWISYIYDGSSDLDKHYKDVLPTLASHWWTFPRTQTQRQAILDADCHCDDEIRKGYFHQSGISVFRDDPRSRATVGRYFMTPCYQLMALGAHTELRFDRWPSSSQWPYHLMQIIPYGADATCREIISWAAMKTPYGCAQDLSLYLSPWLSSTACITANLMACSASFARALVQKINLTLGEWEAIVVKHPAFEGWYEAKLAHIIAGLQCWTSLMDRLVKCSDSVAKIFISHAHGEILACLDRLIQCRAAVKRNMPLPLLTSFEAFTVDDDWNDLRSTAGIIGGRIYALYPPSPERLQVSLLSHRLLLEYDRRCMNKVVDASRAASDIQSRLWYRLIKHAALVSQSQICSNIGCPRTTADTQGSMRVCRGCKLFSYCSRLCQSCAWNAPGIAHRDFCHALRFMYIRLNLTRKTLQECERVVDSLSFPLKHAPSLRGGCWSACWRWRNRS